MKPNELAIYATEYDDYLNRVGRRVPVSYSCRKAEGFFMDVYKRNIPAEAGAYWFHIPKLKVFYTGKTHNFRRRNGVTRAFPNLLQTARVPS